MSMFGSTLRPLARTARCYSTRSLRSPRPSPSRNTAITSFALLFGTLAYASQSRSLHANSRVPESVLDQDNLKENVHPRSGQSP